MILFVIFLNFMIIIIKVQIIEKLFGLWQTKSLGMTSSIYSIQFIPKKALC